MEEGALPRERETETETERDRENSHWILCLTFIVFVCFLEAEILEEDLNKIFIGLPVMFFQGHVLY